MKKKAAPWGGWEKLRREEVQSQLLGEEKSSDAVIEEEVNKRVKKLDLKQFKHIDKRKIQEEANEHFAKSISGIEKHKHQAICPLTGEKLTNDRFLLYQPKPVYVSRKVKQAYPACKNCHSPVTDSRVDFVREYCEKCRRQKRCSCCKQAVEAKEYYHRPFSRGIYCLSCFQSQQACAYCDRPLKREHTSLYCEDCSAAKASEDSDGVFANVKEFLFYLGAGTSVLNRMQVRFDPEAKKVLIDPLGFLLRLPEDAPIRQCEEKIIEAAFIFEAMLRKNSLSKKSKLIQDAVFFLQFNYFNYAKDFVRVRHLKQNKEQLVATLQLQKKLQSTNKGQYYPALFKILNEESP